MRPYGYGPPRRSILWTDGAARRSASIMEDMITVDHVSKRYGDKLAVDDLTFTVKPGIVTGFLGPNGAGKSTTMRMMLGLDAPTTGNVDGQRQGLPRSAGSAARDRRDARGARHPHRPQRLQPPPGDGADARHPALAASTRSSSWSASRRSPASASASFSLGMAQRLGVASALLGDPATVILDEPANGLDPEGILWIRNLLKGLAADGRTVFLSSHLMSEIALTAEHLIVIGRGRMIADTTVADIVAQASKSAAVRVRTPDATPLRAALVADGATVASAELGLLEVHGLASERIGEIAAQHGLVLHELTPLQATLEDAFMSLTGDSVEYHAGAFDISTTGLETAA